MNREQSGLESVAGALIEHENAVVITHIYPDGDAIGSLLGMGLMLNKIGCQADCTWPAPFSLPRKYGFLPGKENLRTPDKIPRSDNLLVALDCADIVRFGDLAEIAENFDTVINIDHHHDNGMFGNLNLIREDSSSTTEILFDLSREMGISLDESIATCLYTGLVTDTGKFQFNNTKEKTFLVAAELIEAGVVPHVIYRELYQNDSLKYLKLVGRIMQKIQYDTEIELVYGAMTQGDIKASGVEMTETEDVIECLRSLRGHKVAALFKELPDGKIRVSLRSRYNIDVCKVAKTFGGGGHRVAAGYTSPSVGVEMAIDELKESLRKQEWCSAG